MFTIVLAAAALAGCRKEAKEPTLGEKHDEAQDRWAIDSARMEADRIAAIAPSELAGSTWRLLRLTAPDGKVILPDSRELYSVEFDPDGKLNVVGGCNRGSGTWKATSPNGLSIGPLATTRAMCPAESMSARYLGDFERMQSYQIVGGNLFIKLAADSGIYLFAPEVDIAQELGVGDAEPEVIFVCTDSVGKRSRIFARFEGTKPDTVTLRVQSKSVVVPQVVSASGAKYEGKGVMFWNKGREARVTWGKANLNCITTRE
jgi:heat shock protein HslJ